MGMFDNVKGILSGNNYNAGNELSERQRALAGSYDPYTKAGQESLKDMMARYKQMLDTPDFLQNQLSQNWAPSQYAQTQMKWLKNAMNNNAAATGMIGSAYSANTMGMGLQDILSQDQNKYIDRGMGVFDRGLSGEEGVNTMGYNALNAKNSLLSGANMADYNQRQANAQSDSALVGQGLSLASMFATGGAGGMPMLAGAAGRNMMPDFTQQFQAPQANPQYVPGSGTPPYR